MGIPSSRTPLENTQIPTSVRQDREIVRRATSHLAKHAHFRCHMDCLKIDSREEILIVSGKLPSFYLKQVLQTILREVSGVKQVDNRVHVTSATGLSSAVRHSRGT